jgi:cell filamentation protein
LTTERCELFGTMNAKWWFSVLDIVGVLNEEPDYYQNPKLLEIPKAKLKKENSEVVSATTQLEINWRQMAKSTFG